MLLCPEMLDDRKKDLQYIFPEAFFPLSLVEKVIEMAAKSD